MECKAYKILIMAIILMSIATSAQSKEPKYTTEMICKAAMATSFRQNIKLIKTYPVDYSNNNLSHVEYVRTDENKLIQLRCKLDADRVLWALENDGTGKQGRWRVDPADEVIRYKIATGSNLQISETYPDKSSYGKTYNIKELYGN